MEFLLLFLSMSLSGDWFSSLPLINRFKLIPIITGIGFVPLKTFVGYHRIIPSSVSNRG